MRRLLILGLVLASAGVSAETFRWVDPAGRVVISDTPPPGKAKGLLKTAAAADSGDALPFATRRAAEAFPVTLFTAADCLAECKQARELLNGRGVPFTEKIVQKPEDGEELRRLIGDAAVPALKVGNQRVRGYESGSYHNLLDLAGYPKTAAYGSKPAGGSSQ